MDYTAIVSAVDMTSALAAIGSIAAAVFVAHVAIKGIKLAKSALR
jgi:hypothetical protein